MSTQQAKDAIIHRAAHETLYYIQNLGYCGNCLRFWKDGGHGYTSNLDEAWRVTRDEAEPAATAPLRISLYPVRWLTRRRYGT